VGTDADNSQSSSQSTTAPERRPGASSTSSTSGSDSFSDLEASARTGPAKTIPRRPRVTWWIGIVFALMFAVLVTPAITAERWLSSVFDVGRIVKDRPASLTVRVPAFAGLETAENHLTGGGVLIARGELPDVDDAAVAESVAAIIPRGPLPYIAFFVLAFVFATIFTHHMQRSTRGRLVRVQVVGLVSIAMLAVAVKALLLTTAVSVLVVPVALLAMVPTMVLDRVVGLATGILAALVVSLLGPFDLGIAILMLVQASTAGLVVAERPKQRWRSALVAGAVTTLFTAATYVLLTYLTTGTIPSFADPLRSPWLAAAIGPAIATLLAVPLIPIYQLLVGEITQGKLVDLEDLSNPLLRQIAERSPGTWQHSLMMANMAEIAANTIGASGRLVRVGAYYHDLGKSLQPKYFIENLEPGETSPHDQLPPEVSCDAIFAHVTEGIVTARKAGLHERIIDFMHMHHGNGVLEYFWGKTREQGNPRGLSIEQFRYPGHPPQSRETAILAICDAVEAASRTLKKPEPAAIESLVQRIVYGKLHLGQLDESGLSMSDLRRVSDSLRETIRHANHGRIEYPWQKAQQDASASLQTTNEPLAATGPRLDSLDRKPKRDTGISPAVSLRDSRSTGPIELGAAEIRDPRTSRPKGDSNGGAVRDAVALAETADIRKPSEPPPDHDLAIIETAPAVGTAPRDSGRQAAAQAPSSAAHQGEWRPPSASRAERTHDDADFEREAPGRARTDSGRLVDEVPGGAASRPPPDLITPSTFAGVTPPAARKRAATLPPAPAANRRAPTVPPPSPRPSASMGPTTRPSPPSTPPAIGTQPSTAQVGMSTLPGPSAPQRLPSPASPSASPPRHAGPPGPVDLDNAITNPPPLRRGTSDSPATRLPPALLEAELRSSGLRPRPGHGDEDNLRVTAPRVPAPPITHVGHVSGPLRLPPNTQVGDAPLRLDDPSRTEPTMPKLELPLRAPPTNPPFEQAPPWASGLADRVEATLDGDEWQTETPVVPPTRAELRALLGTPDLTRRQSVDELEALHRAADDVSEPELLPHRRSAQTAEVDPDDIEAAIEIAPPARNRPPSAIAVAKPKKPER